ncbi:MAG: DUF4169 family protein [Mesorhizobium sp.]|uniref:DUF4169 family protein n=1 Tax=unclassified Mesorhizobium TaxID=325217 RepID=UPI000F764BF0|nr:MULTISPECIES: DUF4169 family protein [unclassified Mesorhizobium]RVD69922.1 DUF4169 family protein [Mesorhizobium sp. M4A.F.Ca.ET.029.04.2.1]AZO46451.1 DUF4169 family protein [Mesorhizobium sp. M4B.F.Ca.ET.058.02.1.1]RUX47470.1 DUF4169 family protein [Mesorhizobium sp. M4A.F.Ca.ET.050.02.1.1]RVC43340.1 DUF4169 family protein [Mesorhizobium sp. M4A.F.Ca.ET.090.04.2.1]RVC75871.1 DUF4169 family protein [Mesorhizobium sp. M4A.F.Ca.ET.022.05.2.1]
MGDVVNLRQVRKQKARTEKERQAGENRALHGRSKADRDRDRMAADKAEHFIADHRREKPGDSNES